VAGPTNPLFDPHHGSANTGWHGTVTYGNHHGHRGGGGTKAAPEPSTWMLLATGLAMLGSGAILRRRVSI
jgi:PEP-CTERM motif